MIGSAHEAPEDLGKGYDGGDLPERDGELVKSHVAKYYAKTGDRRPGSRETAVPSAQPPR